MPARLPNSIKSWFIVGVTGAALITAGAATAAGGPGGGGGGGGAKVPVGVVAAPPAATGGGAGAVNALMSPTVPLTAVGGANENPTAPGSATLAVGTLRVTPARGLAAGITNMDPARYPVGCLATFTINGAVSSAAITLAVAPAVGTSAGAHAPAAALGTNHVALDITCATSTTVKGVVVSGTHQTHWVGTI